MKKTRVIFNIVFRIKMYVYILFNEWIESTHPPDLFYFCVTMILSLSTVFILELYIYIMTHVLTHPHRHIRKQTLIIINV